MHRDERIFATEPQKVLIVEDELLLALNLEAHLEFLGRKVVGIAGQAKEAMALTELASHDLALVDVNLRDGLIGPQIAAGLVKKYMVPNGVAWRRRKASGPGRFWRNCAASYLRKELEFELTGGRL
ncbi:hypothetical protein [Brucella pituitosa]|uniref:hypothetical protein n=1 Tax=Brucella pituitosa TaxID=571256 RepID=UPI003F4AF3B1